MTLFCQGFNAHRSFVIVCRDYVCIKSQFILALYGYEGVLLTVVMVAKVGKSVSLPPPSGEFYSNVPPHTIHVLCVGQYNDICQGFNAHRSFVIVCAFKVQIFLGFVCV